MLPNRADSTSTDAPCGSRVCRSSIADTVGGGLIMSNSRALKALISEALSGMNRNTDAVQIGQLLAGLRIHLPEVVVTDDLDELALLPLLDLNGPQDSQPVSL